MAHPDIFQMKTPSLVILTPIHPKFENGFSFNTEVYPTMALDMIKWLGRSVKYGHAEHFISRRATEMNPSSSIEFHFASTRDAAMFKVTFAKMINRTEMSDELRDKMNAAIRAFNEQSEISRQCLIEQGIIHLENPNVA